MLPQNLLSSPDETKPKKIKKEQLKVHDGNTNSGASLKKRSSKRSRITQELSKDEVKTDGKDDDVLQEKGSGAYVSQKASPDSNEIDKKGEKEAKPNNVGVEDNPLIDNAGAKPNKIVRSHKVKKHTVKFQRKESDIDVNVPVSHDATVAGEKGEEGHFNTSQNMVVLDDAIIDNPGAKSNKVVKSHKVNKHGMKLQRKKIDVDVPMSLVKGEKGEDRDCKTCQDVGVLDNAINNNAEAKPNEVAKSQKVKQKSMKFQPKEFGYDVPLPRGISLTTVAGIELSPEDVGHALQFLEFCAAFGKVKF